MPRKTMASRWRNFEVIHVMLCGVKIGRVASIPEFWTFGERPAGPDRALDVLSEMLGWRHSAKGKEPNVRIQVQSSATSSGLFRDLVTKRTKCRFNCDDEAPAGSFLWRDSLLVRLEMLSVFHCQMNNTHSVNQFVKWVIHKLDSLW